MLTATKRFVGIDQYGHAYWLDGHPRKELLQILGYSRAQKIYRDDTSPQGYHHVGYIIGGLWIEVFALHPLSDPVEVAA